MGKPTGFMDYKREVAADMPAIDRTQTLNYLHGELNDARRTQQAARCMDCGVPFCQAGMMLGRKLVGCPLRNLIPEWNDQLYHGQLERALERLLRTNCFPEFTGYVCPAPCEKWCSARKVSGSVTINDNERYIIETAFAQGLIVPRVPASRSGRRVAVVGAGPAGLTVATLLNQRGHAVTVFEREKTPGGLLVYGIPNMKLPKPVVARRIEILKQEGIIFECGVDVGGEISTVAELQREFDAVILAHGAHDPRIVEFDGASDNVEGVCFALEYRGAAAKDYLGETVLPSALNAHNKKVAVIGAGNSANDCIATALRQDASDIVQLIRRPAADYGEATDYAHVESQAVFGRDIRMFETQVAAVHSEPSRAESSQVEAAKTEPTQAEPTSKKSAQADPANTKASQEDKRKASKKSANKKTANTNKQTNVLKRLTLTTPAGEKAIDADMLIIASGFKGAQTYVRDSADESINNMFTAGDATIGSSLVVRAMANAREVAREVDTYLMGYTSIS